jgi:glycosyltransferase involved in cell wall biosynthesis
MVLLKQQFFCDIPIWKRSKNFLYVGRLVPVKGIKELVQAYTPSGGVKDPWGLKVAGAGPLADMFSDVPGVDLLGFVQPANLPELMHEARCLVLPSLWEPWGVVLHEATAAGLPVIATYPCGAIAMFVRDGVNGYVVSPQPQHLTRAMVRISTASQDALERMSATSSTLAELWNPAMLSRYFIGKTKNLIG